MNNNSRKTGTNSAYRKAVQDRKTDRLFTVIGAIIGLFFLSIMLWPSSDDDTIVYPAQNDYSEVQGAVDHPLTTYSRGRSIEEIDELID